MKKAAGGKWKYTVPREGRTLKPRCHCKLSGKQSRINCQTFTDEDRLNIFTNFWKSSWNEKKAIVRTLVTKFIPKDTKHRKNQTSRRKKTLQFHLKKNHEELIRVCKIMFLNTLGLNEWCVLSWLSNDLEAPSATDKREVQNNQKRMHAKEFLQELPKMESHYCRSSSQRLYLEPIWDSKRHLYREYSKYCGEKDIATASLKVFYDILEEMKISIFSPKKDQCDTCLGFQHDTVPQDEYEEHQMRKEEARSEKANDAKDSAKKFVFTMDAQAVFICPRMKASALYYRTKLTVHNFTIYDLRSHKGWCSLWDETEGDLSANVFATLITDFIESVLRVEAGDTVILWSDGCGYQNRNSVLSNALLNLSIGMDITIEQKFLEKGHTQMECDSMHSTIERKLAKRDNIYLPSSYIDVCRSAKLQPYEVKYYTHDQFNDFSKIKFYSSIRPGKNAGDPTVSDLRALQYCSDGTIKVKLRHPEEWTPLEQFQKRRSTDKIATEQTVPKLFKARLPIDEKKWKDLQAIKSVLPRDTHSFYDNIKYCSKKKNKD